MVKHKQKYGKNANFGSFFTHKTHFKRFSRAFFMFLMVNLIGILCVTPVLGLDFDNSKFYDKNKKEVTIKNSFGLGKELFKAKLITPQVVKVIDKGEGIYQKVGEFEIKNMDRKDFKNAFGKIETFDINKDMEKTNKNVIYKYRKTIESYDYPIQDSVCPKNYKSMDECDVIVKEYKTHYEYDWIKFNNFNELPVGEVVIGVFVDIKPNEYGEWIPTFFGKEVNEWAAWLSDLNTGLDVYYKMNETSGTKAVDADDGVYNGTTNQEIATANGKIGSAFNFSNADSDYINMSYGMFNGQNQSVAVWIKPGTWAENFVIWSVVDDSDSNPEVFLRYTGGMIKVSGPSILLESNIAPATDEWSLIVFTMNDSAANLWINNTLTATDTTTGTFNPATGEHRIGKGTSGNTFNGILDEFGLWNRSLTDDEIDNLWNNGSGNTYTPFESITLTLSEPTNGSQIFLNEEVNFMINSSIISGTLNNISLYINGILNETINISGTTNSTTFSKNLVSVGIGLQSWNATACSISGLCDSFDSLNYIDLMGINITSTTFNNNTLEGATETFSVNFTKTNSVTISSVNLIYEGTLNSFPYTVTGDNITSSNTITIPNQSTNTNASFYWNIILTDDTVFNSTSNNQSIEILNVDNCTINSNLLYNFSQFDEDTKDFLTANNTIELQFNLFNLDKTINMVNFSQKFTETNPAQICLNNSILDTVNYSAYVTVKYSANLTSTNKSYTIEYYNILNETISNASVPYHKNLYDLKEDDSTAFRLTYRDSSYDLAPNILVQIHRQYIDDNDFKIVEIPLTDSNGQTILNLVRNEVVYNLIMVNEAGETVATFNSIKAFCKDYTIGECTINLNADSDTEDTYNRKTDFSISISNLTYINATQQIALTFLTDDLLPKTVEMVVVRNNDFGNRSVCSNSLTAASGLLTCNVSSITNTDQFLFVNIFVEGNLFSMETVTLNPSELRFATVNGAFFAFLIILFIICLTMDDRRILLISLGLGWVVVISLGLINGKFIGTSTAGIWLLVTIVLMMWKLNKEEGQ